ncbi:MAG: glycine cleavage system protein T [Anaerolineae bacterium]|nr:glycine cleavage system protein T [Anaerolineae bacterium]
MTCFDLSNYFSCIRLRGNTRLDFLQRMSTGDLRGLSVGEGRTTVLTTPIGRIVDWLAVLADADSLLLLGSAGAKEKTLRWLRKHIFFNDDVQVGEETPATILGIFDEPERVAALAGTTTLPCTPWSHCLADGKRFVRAPVVLGEGWFVIGALDASDATCVNGDWERHRIHSGYPAFPHEISEDYIPLETGLWGSVSFAKGCYTGQEVIARMESRGQIAKKLCVVTSAMPLVAGDELLSQTGDLAGRVTSAAGTVGMAYLRTAFATPDQVLETRAGTQVRVQRVVQI